MKEGFVVEVVGTEIDCPKCNHSWELESDDDENTFDHNCGYDSQKQEYDFDYLKHGTRKEWNVG